MGGLMKKCEMTEEDIKLQFITPAIEAAGWDRQRQIKMEYNFTDGRVIVRGNVTARGKRKKADYLLYYKPNLPFRAFKPDFFDLIVIDECHRGSAKEDSRWRKILEYFHSATQIGMTATPKETKEVSNISYFGEAIYTYSLKQGIDDGFLAPYKVFRVGIDKDLEGWRPVAGQRDIYGYEIDDREYNIKDYDKNLIIDERTVAVAKRITRFLRENDRFAKTIVFCVDIGHAERMRQALVNENSDLVAENTKYVMRITGDNAEGKAQLDYFIAEDSTYPVIVTTSKLMTTGVDCKTCRLIVLDNNINSMTEFKQIIGRGTRLKPDYGNHALNCWVGKIEIQILWQNKLFERANYSDMAICNSQAIRLGCCLINCHPP